MFAWHGDIVALSGNAAILKGAMVLDAGVDAARVRLKVVEPILATRWEIGLATAASESAMSIIIPTLASLRLGDRLGCELDIRVSALQPPAKKSLSLFGVDPAELTAEERRWLRQAVLFALEARDPALRASRLQALGVVR